MADTYTDEEIRQHYKTGSCHVFAVAFADMTGLPLGIMWNGMEWHAQPDEDGLGGVLEVVHVYLDAGDGTIIDIEGSRPIDDMRREFAPYEWEVCPFEPLSQAMMNELIENVGNLVRFDDEEIEEARNVIRARPDLMALVEAHAAPAGPSP